VHSPLFPTKGRIKIIESLVSFIETDCLPTFRAVSTPHWWGSSQSSERWPFREQKSTSGCSWRRNSCFSSPRRSRWWGSSTQRPNVRIIAGCFDEYNQLLADVQETTCKCIIALEEDKPSVVRLKNRELLMGRPCLFAKLATQGIRKIGSSISFSAAARPKRVCDPNTVYYAPGVYLSSLRSRVRRWPRVGGTSTWSCWTSEIKIWKMMISYK